jgi:hypothetical protein
VKHPQPDHLNCGSGLSSFRPNAQRYAIEPMADRATLIRRTTFDLVGLPPTLENVEAFRKDSRSEAEAFASLVDRLLASPHYGERMAQHWLDVVRYADSAGFANYYERGNAWRNRDFVVRAFNSDKAYNQFVREQLAGDELYEDAKPEDQNPELIRVTEISRTALAPITRHEPGLAPRG